MSTAAPTFTGNGIFTTYSGAKINPVHPKPEDIRIQDIAHALSNSCRYNGHCKQFYSVAQHSVLVSECFQNLEDALSGLLHDASEAYLNDIVRPVKYQPEMKPYLEIEARLEKVIAERFNLEYPLNPNIKAADDYILLTEAFYFFDPVPDWARDGLSRRFGLSEPRFRIQPLPPAAAKGVFMKRYFELIGLIKNNDENTKNNEKEESPSSESCQTQGTEAGETKTRKENQIEKWLL